MLELKLPWPVSTNKAWVPMRGRGGKARFRLAAKSNTFRLAVKSIVLAAKIPGLPLQGQLEAIITLCPPDRGRRDEDNFAGKVLFDAITKAGVWGDDSQVRRKVVEWGDVVPGGQVLVKVGPFAARASDTNRTDSRARGTA